MNPIKIDDQCLTLTLAGRGLVLHSPEQPFITAVRKEKTYAASYGTVKETVTEKERIPLTELQQEDDGAASATLVFSASGHVVTLSVSWPEGGMLRLDMAGDVNGDLSADIADVNAVINVMLGSQPMTDMADQNGSGTVDISDVNRIINLMLGKR